MTERYGSGKGIVCGRQLMKYVDGWKASVNMEIHGSVKNVKKVLVRREGLSKNGEGTKRYI